MDTGDWLTAFLQSLHFKRDRLMGRKSEWRLSEGTVLCAM
jgi:hypothetical protein